MGSNAGRTVRAADFFAWLRTSCPATRRHRASGTGTNLLAPCDWHRIEPAAPPANSLVDRALTFIRFTTQQRQPRIDYLVAGTGRRLFPATHYDRGGSHIKPGC